MKMALQTYLFPISSTILFWNQKEEDEWCLSIDAFMYFVKTNARNQAYVYNLFSGKFFVPYNPLTYVEKTASTLSKDMMQDFCTSERRTASSVDSFMLSVIS